VDKGVGEVPDGFYCRILGVILCEAVGTGVYILVGGPGGGEGGVSTKSAGQII